MKTNPFARIFLKIRPIMLCLGLAGMVAMAFVSGERLAARFGQYTMPQTDVPPAPNLDLGDVFAAADR